MRQHICNKVLLFIFFSSVLGSGRARQVLGKNGRKLSFVALGVGDFISFLFDVGYGFVVICFTKRTLTCEQALHWGRVARSHARAARSCVLSPYMESLLAS